MSFEKKYEELEKIMCELEKNNLTLEDSVNLYEKGVKLLKDLQGILGESKGKLYVLKKNADEVVAEKIDEIEG